MLTTTNFPLLSVFIMMISPALIRFSSESKPLFCGADRFGICSPFSVFSSKCLSDIFECKFLLISIKASSSTGNGWGRVMRLHSARSVTRRLRSSYSLLIGLKVCLASASSSSSLSSLFSLSLAVSSFGTSSLSSSFFLLSTSSSSFFLCIRTLAYACSCSNSNSFFVRRWITENFV